MLRTIAKLLFVTTVLVAMAGPGLAERRWLVTGTLDDYDPETHTVEVAERTIQVTPRTLIKHDDGSVADWGDVEARDGEHVDVLVTPGHPHPVAETLVLADEVEDE